MDIEELKAAVRSKALSTVLAIQYLTNRSSLKLLYLLERL